MPELAELEPTHRRCLDCDDMSEDISWEPCEMCGSDAFEFLHRSRTPLNREDDDDSHIAARFSRPEVWEYPAKEPE